MRIPRWFGCIVAAGLLHPVALAAGPVDSVPPKVADVFAPLAPGAVKLGGHLGAQIDLDVRARVGAQDVAELITPFRVRQDQSEWRS
jgi:hypothetical protein